MLNKVTSFRLVWEGNCPSKPQMLANLTVCLINWFFQTAVQGVTA